MIESWEKGVWMESNDCTLGLAEDGVGSND